MQKPEFSTTADTEDGETKMMTPDAPSEIVMYSINGRDTPISGKTKEKRDALAAKLGKDIAAREAAAAQ